MITTYHGKIRECEEIRNAIKNVMEKKGYQQLDLVSLYKKKSTIKPDRIDSSSLSRYLNKSTDNRAWIKEEALLELCCILGIQVTIHVKTNSK